MTGVQTCALPISKGKRRFKVTTDSNHDLPIAPNLLDRQFTVAEPYYRSLEAASRTFSLANELKIPHVYAVANKFRNDADRAAIDAYCAQHGMPLIGAVPFDEGFAIAEQAEQAPADIAGTSPGLRAIEALAERLIALETRAAA